MTRLIALLLLLAGPALAQGTDCAHAMSPAERAICADPALRAADAELGTLFAQVRAAATPEQRSALVGGQRAWLRQRTCVGSCLADKIIGRRDALRALAATTSPANPGLGSTVAVWLSGTFRIAEVRGLGGLEAPARVPGLILAGTVLRIGAGEACIDESCGVFGLDVQRLADGPGREGLPALLGLPETTPYLLAMRDGQAAFGLVVVPGGDVFALANACAPSGDPCGWVRQDWVQVQGGTMNVVDLAAP